MPENKASGEDMSAGHIREHYRRLAGFKGIGKEGFRARVRKRLDKGAWPTEAHARPQYRKPLIPVRPVN